MFNTELIKRIFTSLILLPILVFVLHFSKITFIFFLIFVYLLCFYEVLSNTRSIKFNLIANFFLVLSLYSFYYLRGTNLDSLIFVYWLLISTFLSDIGGYIVGKTLKGKKLTRISPKKTYSGSIGSFLFSLVSLPVLNNMQMLYYKDILINFYHYKFFILTIIISFVAQSGDIFVSFWKRKLNIKDTSKLLPGHGGVLDRIDGLIFVFIFFLFLKLFKFI